MKRVWLVGALGELDAAELKALTAAISIIREISES
jgi:hypothetical protein